MSVPRRAFFYWSGGPLPWLRAHALASFRRHHPGWDVVLGSPEPRVAPEGVTLLLDDVTDPRLPAAARSDVWRYHALREHGGVYADTDVVFVRNMESLLAGDHDAWITTDMGTPAGRGVELSIGVLAASRGSELFGRALEIASLTEPSRDYQSHGTSLLAARWRELVAGLSIGSLPARSFYRGWRDDQVARLWSEPGEVAPHEFAVHWYSGSPSSALYAGVASVDELPDCRVRRAIEAMSLK